MKKYLKLLLPIMLLLAACNPISTTSDTTPGSNVPSDTSSTPDTPTPEGGGEDEGDEDEPPAPPIDPTLKTIEEFCDDMNTELANYDVKYLNPFTARDYLINKGYTFIVDPQEDSKFFGYDNDADKVVIYQMNSNNRNAVYPTSSSGHFVVSYQSRSVSSLIELTNALTNVSTGYDNYSVVKLSASLQLNNISDGIIFDFDKPVEIDLNNKSITASVNLDPVIINNDDAIVSLRNGTISSFEYELENESVSPKCVYAKAADFIVIHNMTINCNAFSGYSYINEIDKPNIKTIVDKSNLNAVTVAYCIQDGINYLRNNTHIDGIVDINGGQTLIDKCEITAVGRKDDAEGFVSNEYIKDKALYMFETHSAAYDRHIISSVDPIIIFDRRSVMGTYSSPSVKVTNSTLIPDYTNTQVYGYGIRYIDLKLGNPAQGPGTIDIGDSSNNYNGNAYPKCEASNKENAEGGYSLYTVS